MRTRQQALQYLTIQLSTITDCPRQEAAWLLSKQLECTISECYAYGDQLLTTMQQQQLTDWLRRRLNGEPLAYVLNSWEFWSLTLSVTPDTLIPRPETESLVAWILTRFSTQTTLRVADLGTGSGAIALALASERPDWSITAVDCSLAALTVAKENAKRHGLHSIHFCHSDWLTELSGELFDLIVSNPPYIRQNDPHWPSLRAEPRVALDGGVDGLAAYRRIAAQAYDHLTSHGFLVLEHGFDQVVDLVHLLTEAGYQIVTTEKDLKQQPRFLVVRK